MYTKIYNTSMREQIIYRKYAMANKHMKRRSISLIVRERQMKTTRNIPNRMANIENTNNMKHW